MARQKVEVVENDFRGGLMTEATGIAFPPNACTLTENMEHESVGHVKRRLGFDYENPYSETTAPGVERVITGHTWHNVEGDGSLTIRVQQIASTLHFWICYANQSVSENKLSATIDLNDYRSSNDVMPEHNECSFASSNGRLIVCHPECEPFYVTYDLDTDTLSDNEIVVEIRDRVGLDDGLDVTERPTASKGTLSDEHYYNLLNQGWAENDETQLDAWDTAFSHMPSNADVWWYYRDTSNVFDTGTVGNESIGNYPAPKGHYILNVHYQDRSTASGISGLDVVSTGTKRVSKVAFFHNRVFYGGLASRGFTSNIYASRIIEDDEDLGQCYQEQDPTNESSNVLTAADGAVIPVLGMESCVKLWPLNNAILVFGTNGIWAISGSEGLGFRPTDYTIRKISSISAVSEYNFVDVDGYPIWWNADGIYRLTVAENGGFSIESITDRLIKTEYQSFPARSRKFSKGIYDPVEKKIYWLYASTNDSTIEGTYNYDRVLVLNALTGAFYIWKPATGVVTLHDIFLIRSEGGNTTLEVVTDLEDFELQSFTGDVIEVSSTSTGLQAPTVRFFASSVNANDDEQADYTFSFPYRTDYVDWYLQDNMGQDYSSIIRTGYRIESSLIANFQSQYVWVYLKQQLDSSCLMRGIWEWTNDEDSNRWSQQQQLYNSNRQFRTTNYRRLKVRGKGKALQLEFQSETGKPFTIEGWAINVMRNEGP